ncbi:hypothetical protein ACQUW5_13845 [Legionella sp. CNM-1927-20]|uniref:hypothetical protein n=1 Tax=Legionella sp. CNM-1927-20 TaxID=3422221 RepID=UPI00403A8867
MLTTNEKDILKELATYYKQFKSSKLSWASFKDRTYNEQLFLQAVINRPEVLKAVFMTIRDGFNENNSYAESTSKLFDLLLKEGELDWCVEKAFDSKIMLEIFKSQPLIDGLNKALEDYQITQERVSALLGTSNSQRKPEYSNNRSPRLF